MGSEMCIRDSPLIMRRQRQEGMIAQQGVTRKGLLVSDASAIPRYGYQRLHVRTLRTLLVYAAPKTSLLDVRNVGATESGTFHPSCVAAL